MGIYVFGLMISGIAWTWASVDIEDVTFPQEHASVTLSSSRSSVTSLSVLTARSDHEPIERFATLQPDDDAVQSEQNMESSANMMASLRRFYHDDMKNPEWESALSAIPDDVLTIPSSGIRSFKRVYAGFANSLSLVSCLLYGLSTVASGVGGIDYLSNNAFLPKDIMVNIVGLGLIGSVLFKYLWVSLNYVEQMDQKRLVSYEQYLEKREQNFLDDDILINKLREVNIFYMYPSSFMIGARRFLLNGICFYESISSMILALTSGVFATSSASGVTNIDLLHAGSQDTYLKISQFSALLLGGIILLNNKSTKLKERCEHWLYIQELAKSYLLHVRHVPENELNTSIHNLREYLGNDHGHIIIA